MKEWDSTFEFVDSLRDKSNEIRSGLTRFLVGATLCVAATQAQALHENYVTSAIRAHGPPIPYLVNKQTEDLPAFVADKRSEALPAFVTGKASYALDDSIEVAAVLSEAGGTSYAPISLNSELKTLQGMQQSLADLVSVDPKTIRIARIVSHQIDVPVAPSIGFDDTGNVFLHFMHDQAHAYLTIEPKAMHLFCKIQGQRNIYIDNEPFLGKQLPIKIRDKLSELFPA